MPDYPRSLIAFQHRFPDDDACATYLAAIRWPDGFRCPACDHHHAWSLKTKPWTYECRHCRRQTSVRAGTIMHGSKIALTVWFWAAYLIATHSNGISAFQLWRQLGLGSYKSAWLLSAKLRRAMADPERNPLSDLVEIDELLGMLTGWNREEVFLMPEGVGAPSAETVAWVASACDERGWRYGHRLHIELFGNVRGT